MERHTHITHHTLHTLKGDVGVRDGVVVVVVVVIEEYVGIRDGLVVVVVAVVIEEEDVGVVDIAGRGDIVAGGDDFRDRR